MSDYAMNIQIKKRPWWVWLIGLILLPIEVFLIQSGFASFWEYEPRIAWISLGLALLIAVAYWAFARRRTL